MVSKGPQLLIKLEDKITGQLYANCPIEAYPGIAIEAVSDSSRYFVLRIMDDSGRTAFIGLGFGDRSDSFDLNVALQDHFKWVKNTEQIEKEKEEGPKQQLDLGFKEGETIKINMKITKKEGADGAAGRPKARPGAGSGLLPPPPTAPKLPSPASTGNSPAHTKPNTDWGEFTSSAQGQAQGSSTTPTNSNWVQF